MLSRRELACFDKFLQLRSNEVSRYIPNVEGSEIPQDRSFFPFANRRREPRALAPIEGLFKKGSIIHGWERGVTVSAQGGQLREGEESVGICVKTLANCPLSHSVFNSLHPPLFYPHGESNRLE